MPRPLSPARTALGVAIRARRGDRGQVLAEEESGIPHTTLSRIERGAHAPSADTARALARWLGWSTDEVLDAAAQPAEQPHSQEPP